MSEWAMRRFWTRAEVAAAEGGFTVTLDGRSVKTPAKALLVVPTEALAHEIAAEWAAQTERVDPSTMPHTRMSNSAIDKVSATRDDVADMLAAYGDSDLLCYRADHPDELVARQNAAWDPLLDWAAEALGARLEPRTGVIHAAQNPAALAALSEKVHALSDFELAAFHDLVALSGSLILAFATITERCSPEDAWEVSRIDETWQAEQWGEDEEAREIMLLKRAAFLHADRVYRLVQAGPA